MIVFLEFDFQSFQIYFIIKRFSKLICLLGQFHIKIVLSVFRSPVQYVENAFKKRWRGVLSAIKAQPVLKAVLFNITSMLTWLWARRTIKLS